jgi:uncharacterized membrane protein YkvA (DUF1232 family)
MSKSTSASDLQIKAGFVGGLIHQARLAWRLFNDGRVPGWVKFIPVAAFLYFLSPIDLIPDLALPGLGEVDDVVILLLALKLFVDLSPSGVVRQHLEDLFGIQPDDRPTGDPTAEPYIDAPYRVLDEGSTRTQDDVRRTG